MKTWWISITVALGILLSAVPASANEGIVFESETLVLHPDEKGTSVHTILHVVNTSSSPQDVAWQLPENTEDLQVLVGSEDLITVDQQKLQRKAQLAGNADFTVVYRYRYNFPKDSDFFTLPFSYPAQQLQILLPEENKDIELTSTSIQQQGPMDFQGKSYIQYTGAKISTAKIEIELKSQQQNVPRFHSKTLINLWKNSVFHSVNPHVLTALFVVIVAGGGWLAYAAFRKRKDATELLQDEEEQRFLDLYRQNRILFAKLTELQRKMEAGEVDAEQFARLKATYKDKIVTIQMELKRLAS